MKQEMPERISVHLLPFEESYLLQVFYTQAGWEKWVSFEVIGQFVRFYENGSFAGVKPRINFLLEF